MGINEMYKFTEEYISSIISQIDEWVGRQQIFPFFAIIPFPFPGRVLFAEKKENVDDRFRNGMWVVFDISSEKKYKDEIKNMYNGEQMVERLTEYVENKLTELGKNRIQKSIYKI